MQNTRTALMTARQAAEYLGISLSTLRKLEHTGYVLPYRTPGGHRRYSQPMLDEYLESSLDFTYRMGDRRGTAVAAHSRAEKPD